jgi:hypothetical protein
MPVLRKAGQEFNIFLHKFFSETMNSKTIFLFQIIYPCLVESLI